MDVHTVTRNQGPHQGVPRRKVKEKSHVGIASEEIVQREKNANSTMTEKAPKKNPSAAANSGEDKAKPKPTPKPKPKTKPGAPAVGDLSFLEESDDEGIAASVKVKGMKDRRTRFDDDIGEIIFNEAEAVYSTRKVWKPVIKKPLRPDIKKYDTGEVTNRSHREQSRFDAKIAEARAILMTHRHQRSSRPTWPEW